MIGARYLNLAVAAALCAGLAVAPATAQEDEATVDARCLAFAILLQNQTDAAMKEAGRTLSFFFMGRISSRNRPADVAKAMADIRPELEKGIGPMRDRCGGIFNSAGALIQTGAAPGGAAAPAPK
jgi:hypothetical protein